MVDRPFRWSSASTARSGCCADHGSSQLRCRLLVRPQSLLQSRVPPTRLQWQGIASSLLWRFIGALELNQRIPHQAYWSLSRTFAEDVVGALPWNALLFSAVELPESALQGFWLHVAEEEQPSLRMLVDGQASEEAFKSAGVPDSDDPQTILTELVGTVATSRRLSARGRRPSVLGLGSSAKALGSFLARPPGAKATGGPKPKSLARPKAVAQVPKGPPPASADRDLLQQILVGVQHLGDRVSAFLHPASSALPSSVPMPPPMSALPMQSHQCSSMSMPQQSSMMSVPQQSSVMSVPQQSSAMSVPQQSSAMSVPQQSSPMSVLQQSSSMSVPMASSPGLPLPQGVSFKSPPSVISPPQGLHRVHRAIRP
eukprot:195914-Amphidinium_carterae.2